MLGLANFYIFSDIKVRSYPSQIERPNGISDSKCEFELVDLILSLQLSTFDTNLDCENQEEFLVSFIAIGLNPSLLELDVDSSVFGIDVGLPMSPTRNWIESSESTLEHRDFICNFLFNSPSCMR